MTPAYLYGVHAVVGRLLHLTVALGSISRGIDVGPASPVELVSMGDWDSTMDDGSGDKTTAGTAQGFQIRALQLIKLTTLTT